MCYFQLVYVLSDGVASGVKVANISELEGAAVHRRCKIKI